MPHLPLVVWVILSAAAVLLLGLCAATAYAVLRAHTRVRVARWPGWGVAVLAILAALPWLVVRFAPIHLQVSVHGLVQTIAWLLVALAAFALLVLLPIAAGLVVIVWSAAWSRRRSVSR
jgi:hypothetical protein